MERATRNEGVHPDVPANNACTLEEHQGGASRTAGTLRVSWAFSEREAVPVSEPVSRQPLGAYYLKDKTWRTALLLLRQNEVWKGYP